MTRRKQKAILIGTVVALCLATLITRATHGERDVPIDWKPFSYALLDRSLAERKVVLLSVIGSWDPATAAHQYYWVDRPNVGSQIRKLDVVCLHCTRMDISYTDLRDGDVSASLGDRMEYFKANGTVIGDATLNALRNSKGLRKLLVSRTKVTDKGMEAIRELRDVEEVALDGTSIGDATIDVLCGWRRLTYVVLSEHPSEPANCLSAQTATSIEGIAIGWDSNIRFRCSVVIAVCSVADFGSYGNIHYRRSAPVADSLFTTETRGLERDERKL